TWNRLKNSPITKVSLQIILLGILKDSIAYIHFTPPILFLLLTTTINHNENCLKKNSRYCSLHF
ncbi:hypothetical protein C0J52_27583, partial [Blattella germanica]